MGCLFCDFLEYVKEINKAKKIKSKFKVVLREDMKNKGNISWAAYELNYCPECGKRVKETK